MRHDERGSITVMTLGFLVLIGLLVVVVANASGAFLHRQELGNLADGAALAAADGLDEAGFYTDQRIELDPAEARRLVGDYLAGHDVRAVQVVADDATVNIRLERSVGLALAPPGWTSRTTVVAEATSQLRPTSP